MFNVEGPNSSILPKMVWCRDYLPIDEPSFTQRTVDGVRRSQVCQVLLTNFLCNWRSSRWSVDWLTDRRRGILSSKNQWPNLTRPAIFKENYLVNLQRSFQILSQLFPSPYFLTFPLNPHISPFNFLQNPWNSQLPLQSRNPQFHISYSVSLIFSGWHLKEVMYVCCWEDHPLFTQIIISGISIPFA